MSNFHLLNATHLYLKKSNVFVAICPAAACSLRSMNKCVVIELLVWLLNCCVVIEPTKNHHHSSVSDNTDSELVTSNAASNGSNISPSRKNSP